MVTVLPYVLFWSSIVHFEMHFSSQVCDCSILRFCLHYNHLFGKGVKIGRLSFLLASPSCRILI